MCPKQPQAHIRSLWVMSHLFSDQKARIFFPQLYIFNLHKCIYPIHVTSVPTVAPVCLCGNQIFPIQSWWEVSEQCPAGSCPEGGCVRVRVQGVWWGQRSVSASAVLCCRVASSSARTVAAGAVLAEALGLCGSFLLCRPLAGSCSCRAVRQAPAGARPLPARASGSSAVICKNKPFNLLGPVSTVLD